jgi:hypothetical protein
MGWVDDTVTVDVTIKAVTDRAIMVRPDDDPELEVWVPRSAIDSATCKFKRGARGTLVILVDMAEKKGLV